MGYVGHSVNNDVNYPKSVSNRAFGASPTANADFDLAYDNITTFEQGSMGGLYIVRGGDTLASIAAGLWGDASLWWKIAEANGLTSQSVLTEGQSLRIPVGVQRNENNAETFKPYDPLDVLGNTNPVAPKPAEGNNCGVFGAVILVVIAAVVTYFTWGATSEWLAASLGNLGGAIAAGAVSGAAGSVASQGVGVATGIQEKFSWNAVALAAIGGGVGGGLAASSSVSNALSGFGEITQAAIRGAAGNAITQGVGVATGLQDKFSWAGVAAAGVGAAAFQFASSRLPGAARSWTQTGPDGVTHHFNTPATAGNRFGASMASMIADAGARSLIEGSDFGDNIMAALPNVIGLATAASVMVGNPEALAASLGPRAISRVPAQLRAGIAAEPNLAAAIGSSGKAPFIPTEAQANSAAFRVIVGEPRYTATGQLEGTIYDGLSAGGLAEFKTGASVLDSSYQLRLQTYGALVNDPPLPYTIYTSRPVNPTFNDWLTRWGVAVKPLP